MPDAHHYYRQSNPGVNPAFRGWRQKALPRNAGIPDRAADIEISHGHYAVADRLAWLAAESREAAL